MSNGKIVIGFILPPPKVRKKQPPTSMVHNKKKAYCRKCKHNRDNLEDIRGYFDDH